MSHPAPQLHAVSLYDDADSLGHTVARFLEEGFERGEPGLVVASDPHARAISKAFRASPALPIAWLDARATLDAISVRGEPDPERFRSVVGKELDRAASPRIRVYGEMVDLLWMDGRLDAALRLERLWTDYQATRRFSLLCGYGMDLFDRGTDPDAVDAACKAHSHSLPSRDPDRLRKAIDGAFDVVFGPERAGELRGLIESTHLPDLSPLSGGERSAQWMKLRLPGRAGAVLAEARRRYEEHPPAGLSIPAPVSAPRAFRILYAEDDPDDIFFMRRALAKAEVEVLLEVAEDGVVARDQLLAAGGTFDLVLLDLKMPRMGGIEVLTWLRSRPDLRRLPVAVFTSSTERSDIEHAYGGGADLYLSKPQGAPALGALVRGLLAWVGERSAR